MLLVLCSRQGGQDYGAGAQHSMSQQGTCALPWTKNGRWPHLMWACRRCYCSATHYYKKNLLQDILEWALEVDRNSNRLG